MCCKGSNLFFTLCEIHCSNSRPHLCLRKIVRQSINWKPPGTRISFKPKQLPNGFFCKLYRLVSVYNRLLLRVSGGLRHISFRIGRLILCTDPCSYIFSIPLLTVCKSNCHLIRLGYPAPYIVQNRLSGPCYNMYRPCLQLQ